MVRWKCNGCGMYVEKTFGKKVCKFCNLPMGAMPNSTLAPSVVGPETKSPVPVVASVEELKTMVQAAEKQPVVEESLPPINELYVDKRCQLGAHVCRYCDLALLQSVDEQKRNEKVVKR